MTIRLQNKLVPAIFVLIICFFVPFTWLVSKANTPKEILPQQVVYIPAGSSVSGIGELLSYHGLIDHSTSVAFPVIYKLYGNNLPLRAGEFAFSGTLSPVDMIQHLQTGEAHYRRITIPEGYNTLQILETVMSAETLEGELVTDIPEGALLPDTYYYSHGDFRMGIIDRMMAARNKTVSAMWRGRDKTVDDVLKTPEQAVILASIVEKETGNFDERAHVASVFINRLRTNMKLQSDPTTIYSLTNGVEILGRALTKKDLAFKSPFNTYHVVGLPPAPICNPGRESLEAVLHPANKNDFYFVSNNNGGHYFAQTLAQHNKNVQKYRANKP